MTHPIQLLINQLYETYQPCTDGQVASYIPELAKADPNCFGIAIATMDGQVFTVGDVGQPFTLQSISKVFTYGLALEDRGREVLLSKVGVEPTGDQFNSIIRLDENSKRPDNPMVNAGAIATTSLIQGSDMTDRLKRILAMFERYVGHDLFIDMPMFLSERATGDRNRALAYLMRHFGMIDGDIDAALDLYFQQCSVMVNCSDLALMAATVANHGVHPISQQQAIQPQYVRDLLSVMYTCGMYDFSGEWAHRVGVPAKSGVSGGIIAVIPNRLGIAVFSPPLDERGNSVRGIKVCEALSQELDLHIFASAPTVMPPMALPSLTLLNQPVGELVH
jgi:glutaminase